MKTSKFDAIAYVHVSDNPYNIMKEAYSALRVHLNTFRLLEEKQVPSLVDKFGWCTWDAFYLTVEPAGIWHGVKEFANGGLSPRFLIIDDGWQSINRDDEDPNQDSKNLVLGGEQMTARLHRLNEGEKFRKYKRGSLLSPKAPSFDPNKPKMLIAKAIELEHANKNRDKAIQSGVNDLSEYDSKIKKLQGELERLFGEESSSANEGCGSCSCKDRDYGLKALTRDLRTKFKNLDDIWVWHALCGAWGGVRPGTTHLNSKITHCKVSPGLDGTMNDLAVVKIVEGGIGLVHPSQAHDFYNSMHSSLAESGITGVKVDVIHVTTHFIIYIYILLCAHSLLNSYIDNFMVESCVQTLEYVSEDYGGRVQLAKAYYNGLSDSLVNNFNGTGIICSMQQCNDFFFVGTHQISMGRVGNGLNQVNVLVFLSLTMVIN